MRVTTLNAEHATVLRIIARDIENLLVPAIASPNLRFVGGAMKTLLQRMACADDDKGGAAPPIASGDWNELIAWTEAQDRRLLAGEQTTRSDGWAQSGSGQVKSSGAGGAGRMRPIEAEPLLRYLRERGRFDWVRELSVDQAPGGFSKDTFLVRLSGDGRQSGMVLRRDQSFRPLLTSVADEAGVLSTLSEAGLPVPTPLWVETDARHFGAAVLAASWIDGSADEKRWSTDPARAPRVLADAAQLLARLHAFPLDQIPAAGSGVPGSRGDTPAAMVEDIRAFWERIRPAANPLMERALAWLAQHAPQGFARRTIVHSDFGFHNLMVDGDRVVGLLDWEFWHIGDPREDLAYTRSFVERLMPWEDFRSLYEAAGGVTSDRDTDRFYSVLGGLRVAMGCYALQHAVQNDPDRLDSKMLYVGQSFANRFLIDAARVAAASE
jgi:aminoglycoside phosphotransferase (APT) family kinase protein